jgi:hypothetical protein
MRATHLIPLFDPNTEKFRFELIVLLPPRGQPFYLILKQLKAKKAIS